MSDQVQQYKYPCLFRMNINDDYYKPGMRIYSDGLLEINVGGLVIGRSIQNWFELAKSYFDNVKTEEKYFEDKKKPITDPEYLELTNAVLNELNDAITFIAKREGKRAEDILPSFTSWKLKETQLVKESLSEEILRNDRSR